MNTKLNAIQLSGVNTDSLGNYLVALGLLSAVSKEWPNARGCWRNNDFVLLLEGAESIDILSQFLRKKWKPSTYKRWWTTSQKADTKAKSSLRIWSERNECDANGIPQLDAHIVGVGRNVFNPILGTGGNVGKRDLAKACADAVKLLKKDQSPAWLETTLTGKCNVPLPGLSNGGTWFVYANKTFNSGRKWFQDGLISPWSILLATEGSFLLSGGVNRRLSARSRPYAVFPFISEPASPVTSNEVALHVAEFWAPIWSRPVLLTELQSLLRRGLAKIGDRTARSPHEFGVAALAAGVDVGVDSFARFDLRQTTSSQVYEAIPQRAIKVQTSHQNESQLLMELIESGWLDRMPFEPHDSKQKGKFVGLRGPVEAAITTIAEAPDDPEAWRELLLRMSEVQFKIDRNQKFRKQCSPVPPLSSNWFMKAWGESETEEIEIARAIASVGAHANINQMATNVFGISGCVQRNRKLWFPKVRPPQAVWHSGDPLQNMLQISQRRLVDLDAETNPLGGSSFCSSGTITRFLRNELDTEMIARWVPPLSMIDWSNWTQRPTRFNSKVPMDGTELLHALFRPMFHHVPILKLLPDRIADQGKPPRTHSRLLRKVFYLLRFNEMEEAIALARNHYTSLRISLVEPPALEVDGDRIAAALLIPMQTNDVRKGIGRWLLPERNNTI